MEAHPRLEPVCSHTGLCGRAGQLASYRNSVLVATRMRRRGASTNLIFFGCAYAALRRRRFACYKFFGPEATFQRPFLHWLRLCNLNETAFSAI